MSTIALPLFSSDFNQIWNVDLFCQEKEQLLSVSQPKVILTHLLIYANGIIIIIIIIIITIIII